MPRSLSLASRWDADGLLFPYPVVSLRSTTGYRLRSRWDHDGKAVSEHHFVGVNKMVCKPILCSVGLRPSHSAKGNEKPATVTDSRYNEARELEALMAENVEELLEA